MDNHLNEKSIPLSIETRDVSIFYGNFRAVKNINLEIISNQITAIIGPSGCGKSTVLRAYNRMNDFISICRLEGAILFHGENIYARTGGSGSDPHEKLAWSFKNRIHFPNPSMRILPGVPASMVIAMTWTAW